MQTEPPTFKIDKELRDYMPACKVETDEELERQIIASGGAVDPLTVWRVLIRTEENLILLDGHRRYKICQKHNLPFQVRYIELPDRDAAKDWMARWALCRRNLNGKQRAILLEHLAKQIAVRDGVDIGTGRSRMVGEFGLSRSYVYGAKKLVETLDTLDPKVKDGLVHSSIKVPLPALQRLATLEPQEQKQVLAEVKKAGVRTLPAVVESKRDDWSEVDKANAGQQVGDLPDPRVLKETQRQLGRFLSALAELNRRAPNPTGLVQARKVADQLGFLLEQWRIS